MLNALNLSKTGTILNHYREQQLISMREQARKLEVSISFLSDLYHGNRNLSVRTLKKIYKEYKYNITKEDLITLGCEVVGEDTFLRYKQQFKDQDDSTAIRRLIYIVSGESL